MRSPSSSVTREPSRQRSCANTASSAAVTSCVVGRTRDDALGERAVEAADLDRPAGTRAVVLGVLEIEAELEEVRPAPFVDARARALRPTARF